VWFTWILSELGYHLVGLSKPHKIKPYHTGHFELETNGKLYPSNLAFSISAPIVVHFSNILVRGHHYGATFPTFVLFALFCFVSLGSPASKFGNIFNRLILTSILNIVSTRLEQR
jgi:hypothetical protein